MSDIAVLPEPVTNEPASFSTTPLAVIALVSAAALLLELALSRLFSVLLFYHFAFLAISIALLGLGAGGVFAYLAKDWLSRRPTASLGFALCLINAAVILVSLEIVLHVPVSFDLSPGNFGRLTVVYLVSAISFFFTGLIFSLVFARETGRVTQLYTADLAGGAAGCLSVVPLLNIIGGPNTILFAALLMALAAALWAGRRAALVAAAVLVLLIAANFRGRLIDVVYAHGALRDKTWVEFSRWNALSRIEVDNQGGARAVTIDADASTYLMNVDPREFATSSQRDNFMNSPPALASVLRPHGSFAIIGPGGGVDVLRALGNGSPSVTGIEINPIIADTIMRGRYADYTYHLYERPDVHIYVNDGRSWIRGSRDQFDVVQMTLVDTWASTAAGAFSLSENNLYTVEAFREYFEHLKPDGMLVITRWEFKRPREALRVVSLAMEALHRMGVADTRRNFILVSEGELNEDGRPVAVLAKKSAFTVEEEAAVLAHVASGHKLKALYVPSLPTRSAFADLIAGNDPWAFAAHYDFNVAPVSDNAPFFFFTVRAGDLVRNTLAHGMDWRINLGVAVLGMLLIISAAAVVFFLIVPLALSRRARAARPARLLYFVAVGLGYILVEIAFIQRFVLFLGHPVYAMTVVVFLMLLSSGAGSMMSRRWIADPMRVTRPLLLIAAALLAYVAILPLILGSLVGLPFMLKLVISGILLVPPGFVMGMPFPSGLRALSGSGESAVEWAWAMNAASSVLGSVLAMVIAIQAGLNVVLACGAVAYLLAAGSMGTFRKVTTAL